MKQDEISNNYINYTGKPFWFFIQHGGGSGWACLCLLRAWSDGHAYDNCKLNFVFIIVHHIDLSQGGWGPPQTIQTLRNQLASWLFLDGEVDHFIRASPVRVLLDDSELLLAIMFKLFCNWVHTKQLTSTDRVHCINLYPAQRPPSTLVQFWLRLYASPGSSWSWTRGCGYTDVADVYVLFVGARGGKTFTT